MRAAGYGTGAFSKRACVGEFIGGGGHVLMMLRENLVKIPALTTRLEYYFGGGREGYDLLGFIADSKFLSRIVTLHSNPPNF